MDDTQLLRRYIEEGSGDAFAELVRRHLGLVHSAAMRQVGGDFHRAKDVSQMVFTLLARKASSLTRHTALTGWLYATTHFSAGTLMRGERRRKFREEEAYHMNELLANLEPEVDWNQLQPVLDGAMLELNKNDREAILWRYFDALPLAVLGRKLGVSEDAAKKRVERALDKMRASLAKRGARSTTATLALMLADHAVAVPPEGLAENVATTALISAAEAAPASALFKLFGKIKLAAGIPGVMWIGAILLVPAMGAAAYELLAARQANAALVRENESYEALQARLPILRRDANNARLTVAPVAQANPEYQDPKAEFQKFLATFPRARVIVFAAEKRIVGQKYGEFFRSTGLTPLQIGQFEKVVAESWMQAMTIVGGAPAMNGDPMPPAAQMRAILGDQAYQQFLDYGPIESAHYWSNEMPVYLDGTSFSGEQLDQLARVVANNTVGPSDPTKYAELASIDWDAVLIQARKLFSDSQWKSAEPALRTLQLKNASAKARQSP